jgi:hypothetical protein
MYTLARLSLEARDDKSLDACGNPFDVVRRHMKRLGRRFQAAKAVLAYWVRLPELNGVLEIRPIDTPLASRLPPVDMLTNFDSIAGRMFPNKSPNLHDCQQALRVMDDKHELFKHFLHNYRSGEVRPYVHAEIQVLDWFHTRRLLFMEDDPFIACSRPVCLSCLSYFKSHPGRFVEPYSDYSTCLSWRPPVPDADVHCSHDKDQRDTLIAITKSIRTEACHQILKKSSLPSNYSISFNKVPSSDSEEQCPKSRTRLSDLIAQFQTLASEYQVDDTDEEGGVSL